MSNKEFNVLALLKGDERYVYVYDDVSRETLVEAFHAQAADPQLSFNWFDAAVMVQKAEEQAGAAPPPVADAPGSPSPVANAPGSPTPVADAPGSPSQPQPSPTARPSRF